MLIIDNSRVLDRATLALEPSEALELIEKLSYLLRRPEYHHDHLENDGSVLDVLILDRDKANTYAPELRRAIEEYLHRSSANDRST